MNEALARANGKRGTTALKEAMAEWAPSHTKSELEERFKKLIENSSLPVPALNAVVQGEQHPHEVDAFWPGHCLAVQLDGFEYHRTRRDRRNDADADTDLELAGLRVMRLTWADVTTWPGRTLRRLAGPLADGRRD